MYVDIMEKYVVGLVFIILMDMCGLFVKNICFSITFLNLSFIFLCKMFFDVGFFWYVCCYFSVIFLF